MKAWVNLRDSLHYRRDAFAKGFESCGYSAVLGLPKLPGPRDVLCIWNRYRESALCADKFEAHGRPVLVAENGYLGNDFHGARWYAICRSQHNGAGTWSYGGPERWDRLRVTLAPWRQSGGEVVLLPQRGIGPPGVRMPEHWTESTAARLSAAGVKFRVRHHPGTRTDAVPLDVDLANASAVVTWGSGAALKALCAGVPTFSDWGAWVGAGASGTLDDLIQGRWLRDDGLRLETFRRLAWAMWTLDEIRAGVPFRRLLGAP